MLLEIFIALLLGIVFGTVTGLFPGIHINLVAAGLVAISTGGYFAGFDFIVLASFIVSMAVTHTFIDFIPSIFLGAPEEDSFLAVLPGHQLLKEGRGYEAVVMTLYGSAASLIVIIIFSLIFSFFLDSFFDFVRKYIPFVLIFVSSYLVLREEDWIMAVVVFFLSGVLGWIVFNAPVREPLLPLLSGLFGISSILVSLKNKVTLPQQTISKLKEITFEKKTFFRALFAAGIAGPLCSFLPGIGSGHAAVIGSEIIGKKGDDRKTFLFLVGAINTIVMALSFVTVYVIGRGRTGAAVAVREILGEISRQEILIILAVVFLASIFSFFIGLFLARIFSLKISKVDYKKISLVIIFILILVNIFLSNWLGVLVLFTASSLGVFCILSGARRINLMGCLLIPTISFYLGF